MNINNFFTSGWNLEENDRELRSKFQMINIAIILSSVSLIYGIIGNIVRDISGLIPFELALLAMNVVLFFVLRKCKKTFLYVAMIETLQFSFLFLFLVYTTEPAALKHIWIFTYPIVLLYFQNEKNAIYWVVFMVSMLLVAPFQPFIEVQYSFYQVSYISFVLIVMSIIIYFYQKKMDEAKELILQQQKIMNAQAKHAVMGEMISMIAHQWRQPLSTVTLNVSNIQIKRLLGEEIEDKILDKALSDISDTVVYLSETIDDFQTFFSPNREIQTIELNEVINKAIGFTLARLKNTTIVITYNPKEKIVVQTYVNELVQVILNILNNAIDELINRKIENPHITIKVENFNTQVKIYIEDNAGGIEEAILERMFEPYFSTKGKNGTGLGLYMSQMIMQKQFNTKIDVTSLKSGATFAIIIPKKLA
jgi:signal transduction histidine kinase